MSTSDDDEIGYGSHRPIETLEPQLGSRYSSRGQGYSVWLVPEGEEEEALVGVQKAIALKYFQIYADSHAKHPGATPKDKQYTERPTLPPNGVLILPDSPCGNTSDKGIKMMIKGVLDGYTSGPIRVTFKDTNVVSENGGTVHAEIKEEQDYAKLDELRTLLKNRLWGPADARRSIPTPYATIVDVSLEEGKFGHSNMDPGMTSVMVEAEKIAKRYGGVLPDLTLTKLLVVGVCEFPIPAKK
ncbi:uncharacterized protein LOC62_03G005115 [Vanrija pseudolonga]|uniref:Uncharacterized protein n=1 Tax=Vanrija pseudolonga TaxID=143232 RepID=A0AAF0YDN2_9TREE|nr:hypothetical protein LOC62_03G005115 [Vanrija pseudolonga]